MPLYEYHCSDCDRELELLVRAGEQPACPQCGGQRLTKLLSVVAAPGRETSSGHEAGPPTGPCGAGCGCFPPG